MCLSSLEGRDAGDSFFRLSHTLTVLKAPCSEEERDWWLINSQPLRTTLPYPRLGIDTAPLSPWQKRSSLNFSCHHVLVCRFTGGKTAARGSSPALLLSSVHWDPMSPGKFLYPPYTFLSQMEGLEPSSGLPPRTSLMHRPRKDQDLK